MKMCPHNYTMQTYNHEILSHNYERFILTLEGL